MCKFLPIEEYEGDLYLKMFSTVGGTCSKDDAYSKTCGIKKHVVKWNRVVNYGWSESRNLLK